MGGGVTSRAVEGALRELRIVREVASTTGSWRWPAPPAGDGRPLLLVPGLLAGERTLARLATWLERGGWQPVAAGTGLTIDCSQRLVDRLAAKLEPAVAHAQRPAAVIGQSRGGLLGRVLTVQRPDLVDTVVCLGSPVSDMLDVHPFIRAQLRLLASVGELGVPGLMSHACATGACCASFRDALGAPLPRGTAAVAIHSPSDSFVAATACIDPHAQLRVVDTTHLGMALSVGTWHEIARALDRQGRTAPSNRGSRSRTGVTRPSSDMPLAS